MSIGNNILPHRYTLKRNKEKSAHTATEETMMEAHKAIQRFGLV